MFSIVPESATTNSSFGSSVFSEIGSRRASDGTPLRERHDWPQNPPVAYLVALHGIQSHSGWYRRSALRLAASGCDIRFLDRRGSGLSGGRRGHAPHAERLIHDVVTVLEQVRRERDRHAPMAPVVLLSVSWGGRLAAAVAGSRPDLVDALALLYPGICARFRATPFQRMLLGLAKLAGVRFRTAPIPLANAELFTGDPDGQEFIRTDPLALHRATTSFFRADIDLRRRALAGAPVITCPTLLMLAGRDRIADVPAMRRYFAAIAATDKRLVEFPNATHTLEFDPCFESYLAELETWLRGVAAARRA